MPPGEYFLGTIHRAENVDISERLTHIFGGLAAVAEHFQLPFLDLVHPRTADKLIQHGIKASEDSIRLLEPLGFFDFVHLEKNARVVLTDSGTVQEELCIFGVPNITVRDVTERPETIEGDSNVIERRRDVVDHPLRRTCCKWRGQLDAPKRISRRKCRRNGCSYSIRGSSIRKHS